MSDKTPFVTRWTDVNGIVKTVITPRDLTSEEAHYRFVEMVGATKAPELDVLMLAWNELRGYMLGPIRFPTTPIVMDRLAAAIVAAGGTIPE